MHFLRPHKVHHPINVLGHTQQQDLPHSSCKKDFSKMQLFTKNNWHASVTPVVKPPRVTDSFRNEANC